MKIFVTILLVLGVLSFLLGCGENKKENAVRKNTDHSIKSSKNKETNNKVNFSIDSYNDVLKNFGQPISTEEFENAGKGEVFPGIRAGIGKYYPPGKKIKIKEAIWSKNDSTEIAVWYTKKQGNWIPFDHFEYDKNTDF